jgi:hypothetical protein
MIAMLKNLKDQAVKEERVKNYETKQAEELAEFARESAAAKDQAL